MYISKMYTFSSLLLLQRKQSEIIGLWANAKRYGSFQGQEDKPTSYMH